MPENKAKIIELFRNNVKGKSPDTSNANERHDGRAGHWLERQFGISANATNQADLFGYELKNETSSKTTFGDWSANKYIFKEGDYVNCFSGNTFAKRQDSFCMIFGSPNPNKNNRFSWSGRPCPKINVYNDFGQILLIDSNNDIVIEYCFSKDNRPDKSTVIPAALQIENLEIARWFGMVTPPNSTAKCLRQKLEDKFNNQGWFTCKRGADGAYDKICFGAPMTFTNWLGLIKQGVVFFDSGMYQGNPRPYSQWRANNAYWDSLIISTYS